MTSIDTPVGSGLELGTELDRLITLAWSRLLREVPGDLGRTSASVLRQLHDEGPQRITALAASESVAQPTMSALVQRLERRGLVCRTDDPADARANLVQITAAGEGILNKRERDRVIWFEEKLAGLEGAERDSVMAVLRLVIAAIGDPGA